MPPRQSQSAIKGKQGKPASPPTKQGKKGKKDIEESKEDTQKHNEEGTVESEEDELDELLQKYGFTHQVDLDLTLPTEEKEVISDYEMKFIDRNYLHKKSLEAENRYVEPKAESLNEATSEYEASLADVIVYLKKSGYPLENCFISFFSPVFSAFINCGLDPLPSSIKITKDDL
jgi:hypothetical protein